MGGDSREICWRSVSKYHKRPTTMVITNTKLFRVVLYCIVYCVLKRYYLLH